jgi:electron transport complex protein RnfB
MKQLAKDIDAILPQTQCGLCSYGGCMPYANALANQETTIDRCPPGGIQGLIAIAELTQIDPAPYFAEMEAKAKPPMRAVIREAECIGCAKCIKACPVDAILGSGKSMHTVIATECTGCELCIAPCPVDCIDMQVLEESPSEEKKSAFRNRFYAREARLTQLAHKKPTAPIQESIDKKTYIQAAILRAKAKKLADANQS